MKRRERLAAVISQLIENKKYSDLCQILDHSNILEITRAFSRLETDKQKILLDNLPIDKSTRILKLSLRFNDSLSDLLERLEPQKLFELISHSDPDDARELLQRLSEKKKKKSSIIWQKIRRMRLKNCPYTRKEQQEV